MSLLPRMATGVEGLANVAVGAPGVRIAAELSQQSGVGNMLRFFGHLHRVLVRWHLLVC